MTRIAIKKDIIDLASMMYKMYAEVYPTQVATDGKIYITEVVRCMNDPKQVIFIDDELRGFFIMVDETEAMTPNMKVFNGTRVYVAKEHRNGRVLHEFYETMFKAYPEGDILGLTEINSRHIRVLEKRHTRIANLYRLKRSQ